MSNLLSQASLVMIPSGYKEDVVYSAIPTNGNGDLSFTRASNGTRVNSAGLVEVCPWNLCEYSEELNIWTTSRASVTTNATTAPNGTTTADKVITDSTANTTHQIYIGPFTTPNLPFVISVYAKKSEYDYIHLGKDTSTTKTWFDLTNGTVGTQGSDVLSASIESVGNGWYRCINVINNTSTSSYVELGPASQDGTRIISGTPSGGIFAWGAQLNIGSTAKPYFPTTDRLNVPRLTYQNGGGGCPSLLLEKQSTNHILYSEDYSQSAWTKNGVALTTNATTSPDGTQNADLMTTNDAAGSVYRMYEANSAGSDAVCTTSVYFKYGNWQYAFIAVDNYTFATRFAVFDLINITNTFVSSGYTATITSVGSGWYKCTITGQMGINAYCQFGLAPTSTTYNNISIANGKTLYIWGTQREQSSYETSYIPTTSSSATRVADACFKTGISSLIGQTEGSIFLDFVVNGQSNAGNAINIYNNDYTATTTSTIAITYDQGTISCFAFRGNGTYDSLSVTGSGYSIGQRLKVAYRYKSGDFALYVNGVQKDTDTSTLTFNGTKLEIYLNALNVYYGYPDAVQYNEFVQFPTALTNAELASITTI